MKSFIRKATDLTPEIILAPEENKFIIAGKSAPEDVRGLYYPVLEWMEEFVASVRKSSRYTDSNHLIFRLDLEYFNSSSAKYILDFCKQVARVRSNGKNVTVRWHYEDDDMDMLETGREMSRIAKVPFEYIQKDIK